MERRTEAQGRKGEAHTWGTRQSDGESGQEQKGTPGTQRHRTWGVGRQKGVTCPPGQAAAVACDGMAAVSVAAVTALTAVRPKCAILWTGAGGETRSDTDPQSFMHFCWILRTNLSHCPTRTQ